MQNNIYLPNSEDLQTYQKQGYFIYPNKLTSGKINAIQEGIEELEKGPKKAIAYNDGSEQIRALHGCHLYNETMSRLARHPNLLMPVMEILKSDVYVYQFKINLKKAVYGKAWPWHQDYTHWLKEDGLPSPKVVNVGIYLDDVDLENGPLEVIPCSHLNGIIDTQMIEAEGWNDRHRADIRHGLSSSVISQNKAEFGQESITGKAGTVFLMDGQLVHGSSANISNRHRRLLLITYSAVDNQPTRLDDARPDYLVARDYTPLKPMY